MIFQAGSPDFMLKIQKMLEFLNTLEEKTLKDEFVTIQTSIFQIETFLLHF